jgi:hypothetical protein
MSLTDAVSAKLQMPLIALTDWVTLLQGPSDPLFSASAGFDREWRRLFRLIALVLLMLGAVIVAFSLGLHAAGEDWRMLASKGYYPPLMLLIGAILAVPYAFLLAPLCRIRITFSQTFFTILLLLLPWVPLFATVWAIGNISTKWGLGAVVTILSYVFVSVALYNFCKGVSILSSCRMWQALVSLLIPVALVLAYLIGNVV